MIRQIAGYVKAAAKGSSCQLLMDSGVGFKKTAIFDGFTRVTQPAAAIK
jgi:hypothetical protein